MVAQKWQMYQIRSYNIKETLKRQESLRVLTNLQGSLYTERGGFISSQASVCVTIGALTKNLNPKTR